MVELCHLNLNGTKKKPEISKDSKYMAINSDLQFISALKSIDI